MDHLYGQHIENRLFPSDGKCRTMEQRRKKQKRKDVRHVKNW